MAKGADRLGIFASRAASSSMAATDSAIYDLAFAERPVKCRIGLGAPAADLVGGLDENIGRHAQRAQQAAQAHHFARPIADLILDHVQIEIGVSRRVAARARAEQQDLLRPRVPIASA